MLALKIDQLLGLAGSGAEVDIGDKDGTHMRHKLALLGRVVTIA